MDIVIRKAQIEDSKDIADIKVSEWKTAYRGIVDDDFLDNMNENIKIENIKNQIENFIVAENDDGIVGFCSYIDYNRNPDKFPGVDCEICALYVKPNFKRNGVGRQLMKNAMLDLKNKKRRKVILGCLKENYPSRAFYEKMGGKYMQDEKIEIGGKEYDEVMYWFSLKKRYAEKSVGGRVKKVEQKIKNVDDEYFSGDIVFFNFLDVSEKILLPNGKNIIDNDYKWLEFYDYNAKIKLTAMYDENNEIIEWYFDIAREIGKENGVPYEDDLYLDVVLTPDGKCILLDEDELKEALERREITENEYKEAFELANDLIKRIDGKQEELKKFTDKYLKEIGGI